MRFVTFPEAAERLRGKSVAVVGSGPSVLDNVEGRVDSHEVVVRINNYKIGRRQGSRCDVHYSFYGNSIRKLSAELEADGVKLCWCKCPDAKPIESEWHERNNKPLGVDFRYIYKARAGWWFTDTFVPTVERFVRSFELLDRHIPTTGFAAILDIIACKPEAVYLTGFDFMTSGIHNVDENWRKGDPDDPIGHRPELELDWICVNAHRYPFTFDAQLRKMIIARQASLMAAAW